MSFAATDAAWACTDLPATVKLVLLAVARRTSKDEVCWPSQRRLAADTGLSERSVRKALSDLERAELIGRTKRKSAGGRTSDLITLSPLLRASEVSKKSAQPIGANMRGDKVKLRNTVATVHAPVDDGTPEPAAATAAARHVVPAPSGSICRQTLPEEQHRENPDHARVGDAVVILSEKEMAEDGSSSAGLFVFGGMPMPGDPLGAIRDNIANLIIEIGSEIGPAFAVDGEGIRDIDPLAAFVLRHPEADLREGLLAISKFWIEKGRAPIRSWSLVGEMLERRIERYPQLRDRPIS